METKSLFALFVVALLALSIMPAAFAQDSTETNDTGAVSEHEDSTQTNDAGDVSENEDNTETNIETNATTAVSEHVEKQGNKLRERAGQIKERLAEAKQNYAAARDKFLSDKSDFLGERQKLVDLRRTNASDEDVVAQAKTVVNKAIDRGISNLDIVKTWLDKISIEDSQRTELSAQLDDVVSKLEAEKAKVDAATTKQELRDISKETRDIWKDARAAVKKVVGIATSERISSIIKTMDNLSAKLDERVAKMKDEGKDTTKIEPLVADFKAKLELANGKYEAAKEKYASITTIDGADAIVKEAHQLIKEAHEYIKEAHTDLVNILKEMRVQKTDVTVDALVNETSGQTAEASS